MLAHGIPYAIELGVSIYTMYLDRWNNTSVLKDGEVLEIQYLVDQPVKIPLNTLSPNTQNCAYFAVVVRNNVDLVLSKSEKRTTQVQKEIYDKVKVPVTLHFCLKNRHSRWCIKPFLILIREVPVRKLPNTANESQQLER